VSDLTYAIAPLSEWDKDCLHWHGKILRGAQSHWCPDWDFMPIDETMTIEWMACTCVTSAPPAGDQQEDGNEPKGR
jgi:hypothetical protein